MKVQFFEGENTAEIQVILSPNTHIPASQVIATINNFTQGVEGLEVTFTQEESALKSILGTDVSPCGS